MLYLTVRHDAVNKMPVIARSTAYKVTSPPKKKERLMHTVEALRHTGAGFVDADLAHKHPLEARRVSVALRTLAYLQKPFITRCNRHPGGKRVER